MARFVATLAAAVALCACQADAFRFGGRSFIKSFRGGGHLLDRHSASPEAAAEWAGSQAKRKKPLPEKEHFFTEQVKDHFYGTNELWSQRFFTNYEYWGGPGSPVFLYIGGEGPLSKGAVGPDLFMSYLAKKHKAVMVAVEHRFFGTSYPTADMRNDNLRLLHSEQALADLVTFYEFFNPQVSTHSHPSPWVSFGGSYPGTLAAWFRARFPHLTQGSVASSAPVVSLVDFSAYMQTVTYAMNYFGGAECVTGVSEGVRAVAALLASESGRRKLEEAFGLCDSIITDEDAATFASEVMGTYQGIVQYNRIRIGSPANVTHLCAVVTDKQTADDPLARMVAVQEAFGGGGDDCVNTNYAESILSLQNITFDGESSMRQWTYMTCDSEGFFQTADDVSGSAFDAFSPYLTVDYYAAICRDAFNVDREPYTRFNNYFYGAAHNAGTNIDFVNGNIDPWHTLGIVNQTDLIQPSSHAVFIEGTAHCGNMYAPSKNDNASLRAAHKRIAGDVADWISEFYKFVAAKRAAGDAGSATHPPTELRAERTPRSWAKAKQQQQQQRRRYRRHASVAEL